MVLHCRYLKILGVSSGWNQREAYKEQKLLISSWRDKRWTKTEVHCTFEWKHLKKKLKLMLLQLLRKDVENVTATRVSHVSVSEVVSKFFLISEFDWKKVWLKKISDWLVSSRRNLLWTKIWINEKFLSAKSVLSARTFGLFSLA